jgi:hypothetical protein
MHPGQPGNPSLEVLLRVHSGSGGDTIAGNFWMVSLSSSGFFARLLLSL